MTTTMTINIDDSDFEVEAFRSENFFESFADYSLRVLLPVFEQAPVLTTIRCVISGFPIGNIDSMELADTVRHAVATLKLNRFDDILNPPSLKQVAEGVEMLTDHLAVRLRELARPGPSLNYKMDRLSESKLARPKQLAILLNQLLWDAGLFRDKHMSLEDTMERIRRSAAVADQIIMNWESNQTLTDLHAGLIELDAKYRIKTLEFSRKERDKLNELRDSHSIKTDDLLAFVVNLIQHRDDRMEPVTEPHRWTQEVYRHDMEFNMLQRPEFSNVIQEPTKKELERAAAMSPEGRAKAAEKKATIDRFADAFGAAFGKV
jgi:hypothetical protein